MGSSIIEARRDSIESFFIPFVAMFGLSGPLLGRIWKAFGREKTHAGLFWIAQNTFVLSVLPTKAGSDLAGNWPLLTAKSCLTLSGNVKNARSSRFTVMINNDFSRPMLFRGRPQLIPVKT
jgi:hypothetical protein